MWLTKLKAGALQVTIGVVMVVALLLFGFVLLVHTHKLFQVKSHTLIQTIHQSNYGLQSALNHPINNNLYDVEPSNTLVENLDAERSFWGLFHIIKSTANTKAYEAKSIALVGSKQPVNRTALYLQDNGNPLVLVGDTKIKGAAYLPQGGVKPGTISGESYQGNQLIYGQQRTARNLPKLQQKLISRLQYLKQECIAPLLDKSSQLLELNSEHSHSFYEETQLLYSINSIHLVEHQLTGNIMVYSETKIIVNRLSNLEDVILIAPEIHIEDGVKGNFQAIASERLYVGKNVELAYPSALVVIEEQSPGLQATTEDVSHFLKMDTKSSISGQVVFIGQERSKNFKAQLLIDSNSEVIGEVFCNQNTELKGSVKGSVFTNNFIANQVGSVYQNHLYHGQISIDQLPEAYVGLLFNNSKQGIAKWLY